MTCPSNASDAKTPPDWGAPAHRDAVRAVKQRDLSTLELRTRLHDRGHAAEEIDAAIAAMQGAGYVNDQRLAESILRRAQEEGRGPLWIDENIQRRGLGGYAAPNESREGQLTRMRALITQRFAPVTALDTHQRARAQRYVLRRGFEPEVVEILFDIV